MALTGVHGWLRAAVLGANDGLVSTASLVVGVAAAEASRRRARCLSRSICVSVSVLRGKNWQTFNDPSSSPGNANTGSG